ncbi:MAG: P1 family peptidase [Chloroflexota bacterium]
MADGITSVRGILVGQADDDRALTGCSVVVAPDGAVVGCDVRGYAPGTRETDLCRPGTLVTQAQAVLLAGGSAFGLDAATGVVRYLYERGLGFPTGVVPVPIVPAAVLFDLGLAEVAWPDAAMGYQAASSATAKRPAEGNAGAGMGATVGKLLGPERATKSGIGTASIEVAGVTVGALMAVNAFGEVVDPDTGRILAGARGPDGEYVDTVGAVLSGAGGQSGNTTIGVVATDARLTSEQVDYLARVSHDGLARTIRPVHSMIDGDAIFALATGKSDRAVEMLALGVAATLVVQRAIVSAVLAAKPAGGLPASLTTRA